MRILIVKLSSLGDVVHAMPVVQDIGAALSAGGDRLGGRARLRAAGAPDVEGSTRSSNARCGAGPAAGGRPRRAPSCAPSGPGCAGTSYDAVLDLQGLTKSALIARLARGVRYGLANRTEGASHEWPARWLVDHALRIEPHIHALDRSRELAARALGYRAGGTPDFGLRRSRRGADATAAPTLLFIHGTSRDDKLWPEADWIALGRRAIADGWRIALPQAGAIGAGARAAPAGGARRVGQRLAGARPRRGDRPDAGRAGGGRRRQRPQPHRGRARPAACPDLQLPDRLAHRAAGRRTAMRTRSRSKAGRRRRSSGLAGLAAGPAGRVRMTTASLRQPVAGRSRLESTSGAVVEPEREPLGAPGLFGAAARASRRPTSRASGGAAGPSRSTARRSASASAATAARRPPAGSGSMRCRSARRAPRPR